MTFYGTLGALALALVTAACVTNTSESTDDPTESSSEKTDSRDQDDEEKTESTTQGLMSSGGGCPCRLPQCWPYCRVAGSYTKSP